MTTPTAIFTRQEKGFLLNDSVFYEVLFALGVSADDATDYCVWEHLNFSRMGHARALLYFFETPSGNRKWRDDIVSEDFGFSAATISLSKDDRERLNKDLFHLSARRLRHSAASKPWPHTLLQQIHERTVSFIDHLLTDKSVRDFEVDMKEWDALGRDLKEGKELCISRHILRDGSDTGWKHQLGRVLQSGKSELTALYKK